MTEWCDRKEPKPFQANIPEVKNGVKRIITMEVGRCAIALFRKRREVDHLLVREQGNEEYTKFYDLHQLYLYMGGVALTHEDRDTQGSLYHIAGNFGEKFNWQPPVLVHDYPDEEEVEEWIESHSIPIEKMHKDLSTALKDDLVD